MSALGFDLFAAASDEEAARYRVLDGLQRVKKAFARNEVYPYLSDLIHLHQTLSRLTEAAATVRQSQPGALKGIDLENGRLVYEESPEKPLLAESLARWSLPLLAEMIEEGRTLYEFVDMNSEVMAVGIMPAYQDEGFLIIPAKSHHRILRYAMSLYEEPDGRYRSLRTTEVMEASRMELITGIKRRLVQDHPELPNPATYRIATSLEFPVEATLLPVAKRKLLQYLAMGGPPGTA